MARVAWHAARALLPEARITAAIRPHLAPLLADVVELDAIEPLDTRPLMAAARRLRSLDADAVLLLPNSFRSAAVAALARIPWRGGYRRDGRSWMLTDGVDVLGEPSPMPTRAYYAHLCDELIGAGHFKNGASFTVSDERRQLALAHLGGATSPVVLLVPGASKASKRWPAERFAAVADGLHDLHGASCCIVAAPGEAHLAAAVQDAAQTPLLDLCAADLSLDLLPALIEQADLVVTNDTGPRHLAHALGTAVVTMHGPTDLRWTRCTAAADYAVLGDPFLPEELVADAHPARCDIDRIPVADVLAVASAALED